MMATKLETLKWLAVDFDGTLSDTNEDFSIGSPIKENIEKLRECTELGYKVIIHTARHWEQYMEIEEWLVKHDVPFKFIQCGKILAHRYIDDRAIPADAKSWSELL
jgi:hydroxymethylpyrimidine pyrophosphatase-like HAD family hydrolase